jgi:hypothetical protein
MIPEEELKKIAEAALEITGKGGMAWSIVGPHAYSHSFPKSSLVIRRKAVIASDPEFELAVYNIAGDQVSELSSKDKNGRHSQLLQQLFNSVVERAQSTDETLRDLQIGLEIVNV